MKIKELEVEGEDRKVNSICRKVAVYFDEQCSGPFTRNLKVTPIVALSPANIDPTKNKTL